MRVASILATGLTVLSTVSALPSDMSPARPMGETPESKALEALTTEPRGNTCETVGNLAMCCRGVGPIRTSCNYALDKRPPIQPANTTVFKAICNKKKKEARCCRFFFALVRKQSLFCFGLFF